MANIKTPWSSVGFLTFKRTYARRIEGTENTEEFEDTVNRVVKACNEQLHCDFTTAENNRIRKYLLELKGTVAGRFLWQLGTPTVDKLGLPSLQNCAFVIVDEPIRPFTWAMDMLMLGSGVGYNIQREYVYKLPKVLDDYKQPIRKDDSSADFILPDTRAGWVKLLEYTLRGAFNKVDARGFSYSTQLVRGKGSLIKGFGGVASGPDELVKGIKEIGGVLEARAGKQLRPIDCLDIMNIIGQVVVSGNVRRSAQIAIGDPDDVQFLNAKNFKQGNIPNWRANSNNSVVCNDINTLPEEFWKTYKDGGEPYGLINLKLARSCGRIGDTQYKDKGVAGFNPCLHPDTLIQTVNGPKKIKDITSSEKVYTMMPDGRLGLAVSSASWISQKQAETLKIKINSGKEVICTEDHLIYIRDKGWVKAKDIQLYDQVVHLSRTRRGAAYAGVRLTTQPTSEQVMEHRFVWGEEIPDDCDIHHIDGDTYNNVISNLECMSHSDHARLTAKEQPNNHQVHGDDGDFISSINSRKGKKKIIPLPAHLKTGLKNHPFVVAIEAGPVTDVYDISVPLTNNFVANDIIVHNCAEQSLWNYETCCLAEIYLSNIKSYPELVDVAKYLYRINKHSLALPCHNKETEDVVHKNMRMGIGITGYLQATEEQRGWLKECYEELREFDKEYSKKHGWPNSIKLTTVKPSGTLSLLPGVTPGVHPGYAHYMVRRIRVASENPLVATCKAHGYKVEFVKKFDGSDDYTTVVVEFPFSYPEGTVVAKDLTAINQLEYVKKLQTEWSDNSVSCTVYYKKEELEEVKEYLSKNFNKNFKSLSFLLHNEHGFLQAPFEEITKEQYDEMVKGTKPITKIVNEIELDTSVECESGVCPIR